VGSHPQHGHHVLHDGGPRALDVRPLTHRTGVVFKPGYITDELVMLSARERTPKPKGAGVAEPRTQATRYDTMGMPARRAYEGAIHSPRLARPHEVRSAAAPRPPGCTTKLENAILTRSRWKGPREELGPASVRILLSTVEGEASSCQMGSGRVMHPSLHHTSPGHVRTPGEDLRYEIQNAWR